MEISSFIKIYQAYLNSLKDGGDKVGDMLARIYEHKGAPIIVKNIDENKQIVTYYGFKNFVDGAKFLTGKANSFEGCNRNNAGGLKCTDYYSAYKQTVNSENLHDFRKIMTIGITKNLKIATLSHLHEIQALYNKDAKFRNFPDTTLSKQEIDALASFLNFTQIIEDNNKKNGFVKEILCNPSNLARILGYDVIYVDSNSINDYPQLSNIDYVVLNRSNVVVMKDEDKLFKNEYKKILIAAHSLENQ